MEFTEDILNEMDFLLVMHNKCKDRRTRALLAGLINVAIEHHIMGEYLKREHKEEWLKSMLNKGKMAFKDKFEQFLKPPDRKPPGL